MADNTLTDEEVARLLAEADQCVERRRAAELLTDAQVNAMVESTAGAADKDLACHIKALAADRELLLKVLDQKATERQAIEKMLAELWIVLDGYARDADELAAKLRFQKEDSRT